RASRLTVSRTSMRLLPAEGVAPTAPAGRPVGGGAVCLRWAGWRSGRQLSTPAGPVRPEPCPGRVHARGSDVPARQAWLSCRPVGPVLRAGHGHFAGLLAMAVPRHRTGTSQPDAARGRPVARVSRSRASDRTPLGPGGNGSPGVV